MRLATARVGGGTTAVRLDGALATALPFADVGALLATGAGWQERARGDGGETIDAADLELEQLVPAPEKVLCVGLNYRAHVLESGRPLPEYPTLFAKFARCLIGPRDEIELPAVSDAPDWEAELAIVIGEPLHRAGEAEALAGVAGYTVANDVSMRDWQRRTTEMLQGKAFERCTPIGPHLVTGDEVDDARDLKLSCSVDGVTMQDSSTKDLIFSPAHLVSYISAIITLMPGDLILTGTPAGVGGARKPPVYLQAGQTVRTTIDGIGELVNVCVEERG
jgi:acylpyruvate hydrolase